MLFLAYSFIIFLNVVRIGVDEAEEYRYSVEVALHFYHCYFVGG